MPFYLFLLASERLPTKRAESGAGSVSESTDLRRVSDPDPDWIRIQSGPWIRIRIRNPDPDPGGQK
jgi:hypothetical protein